jgi:hypothetical protein
MPLITDHRSPITIQCPGCRFTMQRLTLDGLLGVSVEIDLCLRCRAFWFEPFETIHLTPASTLKVFGLIAAHSGEAATSPFPTSCHCPRCGGHLILTHDRQRNTPFQYYRCDSGHGRFTPFVDFLKEKDFIRPLSPDQIRELRQNIRMINCSNCGAPIDLAKASVCDHCGSPLSMLDAARMRQLAAETQKSCPAVETTMASQASESHQRDLEVAALFERLKFSARHNEDSSSNSLIELGLQGVAEWLRDLMDR